MQKKILVLVSNPEETKSLNLPLELKKLQESIQRSQKRDYFTVGLRFAASQTDLRRHILEDRPQIIHFCGHGSKQGLWLDNQDGKAELMTNEFLTDLLRTFADRIECVLLNACDSENLANSLVQHLNYVIGMNQEVYDDAAIAFAEGFYDTLGAGKSYERAFEIGKNAVLGKASSRGVSRKATVVGKDGSPVNAQNQEHLIPVLKTNPTPTPIKPLWLSPEVERAAVRQLLEAIESGFNTIKLFHADEPIVLKDQYIPVQVTLERRYHKDDKKDDKKDERRGDGTEEAELKRIYALKGGGEGQQFDWQEVRRQEARIVVLADPGMGKSTLLRREVGTMVQQAYQALENSKPLSDMTLPLFIRLSTLADEIAAIPTEEAILKIIQERHSNLLKHHAEAEVVVFLNGFLKEQLLSGKVLLLLDALDEVPDGKRKKLLEKLNEFAKAYPTCGIVGTSRIVGYGGRLVDGAKDMEIVPFSQQQTEKYIKTWFSNAPLKDESVSVRGLIQALRERPQIAGLAQNPLLLSLLCSLYQRDQLTLPARRSQIYEQAVTCMLSEWGQTRLDETNDKDHKIEAKTRLLEALAYHFTCEGQEVFNYDDLFDWVEGYLEEDAPRDLRDAKTGDLIAELSESDGILQKLYRDRNDDQYLFLHRTFQEYFTASYLSRIIRKKPSDGMALVQQYFWNYDWHETLTLLAGLMKKPMVLIEAVAAEKDDIFQTQLLLAGRCLAECSQISEPLIDKLIDRIYEFWQRYPDVEFIQSTVVAIGQAQPYLSKRLRQTLRNPKPDKELDTSESKVVINFGARSLLQALDILGLIGNSSVVSDIQFALNHDGGDVWRRAVTALEAIGSQEALHALLFMYNDDKYVGKRRRSAWRKISTEHLLSVIRNREIDPSTRMEGTWILGDRAEPEALSVLTEILNDETENCIVRGQAAVGLGRLGNFSGLETLVKALREEREEIASKAAWALGKLGYANGVDALVAALQDDRKGVMQEAAEALIKIADAIAVGQIGNDKAVDVLIHTLQDQNSNVRRTAAKALGQIGHDTAVDALIHALQDQDSDVRGCAAEALGQIGNDKAVDVLIHTLQDQNPNLRKTAAKALGQIGHDTAVDALIHALQDQDSDVRECAAEALGQIGNDKAVDVLIHTLQDQNPNLRKTATKALGQIGNDRAVDALIQALQHKDWEVRRSVAEILWQIGHDTAIDVLNQALQDPHSNVREYAVVALRKIGNATAVVGLIQALRDENSYIRGYAAGSLGEIGSDKAVDALIQALQDQDSNVRSHAAGSLEQIGSDKAVDALIQALQDQDSSVRSSSAKALEQVGNAICLEKLLQSADPNLIYHPDIFRLVRSLAIRFSKAKLPFIPVYPELLPTPAMTDQAEA